MGKKVKHIIISGGGTGGHLFPAIAIGDSLKSKGHKVSYIGSKFGLEAEILKNLKSTYLLNIKGIQRTLTIKSIYNNLIFPYRFIISYLKSWIIISSIKPDIIIGTGGYSSGLPLLVGIQKKIKTLIQEQNSFPGITTRKLYNKVDSVCIAYESANKYLGNKGILLGNPIRQNLKSYPKKKACETLGLSTKKPTILIVGGSQGSVPINNHFINNYKTYTQNNIQILWQCGKNNSKIKNDINIDNVIIKPFIKNMSMAYSAADIVISRAGALAIEELKLFQKPMILIPFPFAANNHQYFNALELVEQEAAILISQDQLVKGRLESTVLDIVENKKKLADLSTNAKKMSHPNAIKNITNIIINTINDV